MKMCSVVGCGKKHTARGLCRPHWDKWRKTADNSALHQIGFQKGDRNPSRRPERRKEISEWRRNRPTSAETREKQSQTMKRRLATEPLLKEKWRKAATGRIPSAQTRAKISASRAKLPKKMSTWMHKADATFSIYIRKKYLRGDGLIECWSCHRSLPMNEMDCGHFVGRQHKSTRFLEENAHPQCRYCNRYIEGNKDAYALSMVKHYGPEILERLQMEKRKIVHLSAVDLMVIIDDFKQRIADLDQRAVGEAGGKKVGDNSLRLYGASRDNP